ncbi:GNAT family N-acetyltransferase [Haloprofundus sp. MHR1]|uniref:GNAT family N-acetyltransferase n=1 Tax=Haloprofundus sp. MHR1 TaxID=2572921 RepID=UPI0010BE9033|nr:GNAT family N-acetyltransferase [Haloprofundus sp. MHR1]QCJ46845.1 GNAT family N-acetyltransferase [Haloprofundus sp. MHR1]
MSILSKRLPMTASTEESHDPNDRDESRSGATDRPADGSETTTAEAPSPETTIDDRDANDSPDNETAADAVAPVLRPFESDDRDALGSLYETATGEPLDPAWFRRLFVDNPFGLGTIPIHVAEDDGELVAAQLSAAVRVRVGTDVVTALHTIDRLVHPDYEETDLSERLSTAAEERYADSPVAFAFDFPGEDAVGDALDFGYRAVDEMPTYYRIQNPAALAARRGRTAGALGRLGVVVARGYLGAKRRRIGVDRDVAVSRVDGVPADRLAALAERVDADGARAVRDAEFYGWRFGDGGTYRTYFAARDGEAVAAVVVADRTEENGRVSLVDVLPTDRASSTEAADDSTPSPARDAVRTLLVAVAEQHADADLLTAFGSAFPEGAMRAAGFVCDSDYPLSTLTSQATLVAYPYVDDVSNADSWRCGGEMLTDGTVWSATMADHLF